MPTSTARIGLLCAALLPSTLTFSQASTVSNQQLTVPQLESLHNGDAIAFWGAQMPSGDIAFLKQLTRGVIAACIEKPQSTEHRTAAELFDEIRIGHLALSPSHPPSLIVQGAAPCMCDADWNCPFWIIDHQPQPTVVLKARSIQSFALLDSLAVGHFDLVLGTKRQRIGVTELQTFQFDGKRYQRKGCASLAWADEYGTLIIPPRITPERCASYGVGTIK
jgi:hypothetical protein